MQNTCNIQFIKSFNLKYGIYKPREVVNPIKETRAQAHSFLYWIYHLPRFIAHSFLLSDLPPPEVYKSHISNGMINKLYIIFTACFYSD